MERNWSLNFPCARGSSWSKFDLDLTAMRVVGIGWHAPQRVFRSNVALHKIGKF